MRLIILPHAGSGASYYFRWVKNFGKELKVSVVQYPMREQKYKEPMPDTIQELAEKIFEEHKEWFKEPFAIWGHSFGSTLGYEILKLVQEKLKRSPVVFFSSGASAPCDESEQLPEKISTDKTVLLDTLKKIGGIAREMYENQDFMDYYLPIISMDINLLKEYQDDAFIKIPCPLVLLEGDDDMFDLSNWDKYKGEFESEVRFFKGSHFFFEDNVGEFVSQVHNCIKKYEMHSQSDSWGDLWSC